MTNPPNNNSWTLVKILLASFLTASLMLAGWVGVKQDARLASLETSRVESERALVLARELLTKELADIAKVNAEEHARIFTKLDILLAQHGIRVK